MTSTARTRETRPHKTPQRAPLYRRCAPRIRPAGLTKFNKLQEKVRRKEKPKPSEARRWTKEAKRGPEGQAGPCRERPKVPSAWKGVRRTRIRKRRHAPQPTKREQDRPATRHPAFSSGRATDASAIAWARKSRRSIAFSCHQTRCRSLTRREGRRPGHGSWGGWKCLRSSGDRGRSSLQPATGARRGGQHCCR